METTGALSRTFTALLRVLAAQAKARGAVDATAYGRERVSTKEFYTHHSTCIAAAVQLADALTIRNEAAQLQFTRAMGM